MRTANRQLMSSLAITAMLFFLLTVPVSELIGGEQDTAADRLADFSACLTYIEKTGNLVRVKTEVNPEYELAGIAKKYEGK